MVALFNRFTDSASARSVQKIPNVLSLDLRGHGASTIIAKDTINYRTMEPEDFRPYPSDVAAVIERVLADHSAKIDRNKVMIVGASIGANVSVMAAEMVSDIAKVVMLSPGENYRSLEPAPSIVNYTGKILIIAGSEDAYSKASSEKLAPLNANTTSLKIYSGPQHGTDILDANEQAMADVLDWLLE
jgi:pimeloyl-ACP methyl ester carboxylesterase